MAESGRRVGRGVLAALAPVWLVAQAWQQRWMSDDGFIHLRVVRQLAAGNGPVINVGERVEASTSPLWVLLLTIVNPLTSVALPWKAVALGIGFTVLGLVAAQAAGRALLRAGDPAATPLPLGALCVVALVPFWEFASSGLETGLTFGWIGGCSWWCSRRALAETPPRPQTELAGAALAGLGWLIRPDLLIFSLGFGAVLAAALWRASRRRKLATAGAAVALPLAYQVFRMGYYAMVVPNTALAKEAGRAQWAQGWRYVVNLVSPYWLWLPVGLVVGMLVAQVIADRNDRAGLRALARVAPAVAAGLHALYVVRIGGDFMHARLLLPALFGLLAPVTVGLPGGLGSWWQQPRRRVGVLVSAMALPMVLVWLAGMMLLTPRADPAPLHVIEDERSLEAYVFGPDPVRIDLMLATRDPGVFLLPQPGKVGLLSLHLRPAQVELASGLPVRSAAVLAVFGAGSYRSDVDVYALELASLAHPVGSHLDHLVGDRPGHQKPLPLVWQAAGLSEAREVRDMRDGRLLVSADDLEAARRATDCGPLRRYLDDIHAPLTFGRFMSNIVHSVQNTLLRVPADPRDAAAELCA